MSRILVMGDVVDDIVVRPLTDVTEASDTNAEIRMHAGGSAANVAAWLGHLGADAVFLGRAGATGVDRHTDALAAFGVDARIASDPDRDTATIVLNLDGSGERTMYVDRGANAAFTAEDIPDNAFADVVWLHLTGYSLFDPAVRPAVLQLVDMARAAGAGISVDPSSIGFLKACLTGEFLGWIEGVDLIFPNLLEGQFLTGKTQADEVAAALASRFEHVVLKMGSAGGLYADSKGNTVDQRATDATVVDTTGAGDAFAAGFLHTWMADLDATSAMQSGADAAAQAVSAMGARPQTTKA